MRSGALIAALALAGCGQGAPQPQPSATAQPSPMATGEPAPPQPSATAAAATPTQTPSETPKPAASPAPKKLLQAVGTEPFWSVTVLPHARLRYTTPDMANGVIVPSVERKRGEALRYAGRFNGRPFVLDVAPAKCSDGMSDTVYPYSATFVHSGRTDRGCARMR
jgi:uncharacterized membrane protein